MRRIFTLLIIISLAIAEPLYSYFENPTTLQIGVPAPNFNLKGTDGKIYSLNSFKDSKILVIIFTCNHCPTAQAYEDKIIQLTKDYKSKGVAVVAISPNDPKSIRLDELGYTDMSDSFEEMKLRSKDKGFNFPYLYDGETQSVSKAYGPVATPHAFVFDSERKLRYQGRIDDTEKPTKTPSLTDTRNALEDLLAARPVAVATTKVFGCSVKWAEKKEHVEEYLNKLAAEPVKVDTIGVFGLQNLIKNNSDKLRLINVWATFCGPCIVEFPDFITINRMYRNRDFEFISISADAPEKKEKTLKFLKSKQASSQNFIFNLDDKYKLIEAVDAKWQGALPYTILVEPGGRIVYGKQGPINAAELKKLIVENHLIGRYY